MPNLQRDPSRVKRKTIERVLYSRPFLHRKYYDLAAYLCEKEYTTPMRDKVIDFLTDGGTSLSYLVAEGTLDYADLAGATAALEAGRAWHEGYTARAAADAPELDPDPTADAEGDPIGGPDDREAPGAPREYEPTDEERQWYRRWLEEQDGIDAMRAWHDRNDFHAWLEANGGPA